VRSQRLKWLSLIGLLWAGLGDAGQAQAPPDLLKPHRVDIGGRKMNLQCYGKGSPAAVFDQGWGENITDWQKVVGPIATVTRVCVYDRAGLGWSDRSGRPSTPKNITDDLHALLRRAGVRAPVILVGHSIGGLYATTYADRFPSDVAGLVLVDPSFAGQDDGPRTPEEDTREAEARAERDAYLQSCADFGRRHELSRTQPHHCFDSDIKLPEDQIAYLLPAYLKPFRWEAMRSELDHTDDERAFARPWGALPVVVLTHDFSGETAAAKERGQVVAAGHLALAARSTRGEHRVVANAGHDIQNDQPQAVIDAVRTVVTAARTRR